MTLTPQEDAIIVVACTLVAVLTFFSSLGILHKYAHKWHRRNCLHFLSSFVYNIQRLQTLLLIYGDRRRHSLIGPPVGHLASLPGVLGDMMPNIAEGVSGLPQKKHKDHSLNKITHMWSWVIRDGELCETTDCTTEIGVRIFLCLEGLENQPQRGCEATPEEMRKQACKALEALCHHLHLEPSRVVCCIYSDEEVFPGVLVPGLVIGGLVPKRSNKRFRGLVSTAIDILPLVCDIADFCLIVVVPNAVGASQLRFSTVSSKDPNRPIVPKRAKSLQSSSGIIVDGQASLTTRSSKINVGQGTQSGMGPTHFLTALSILALKTKQQAFVVDVDLIKGMIPVKEYEGGLESHTRIHSWMGAINLTGGLLHLWALAVSHGSSKFIRHVAPSLVNKSSLIEIDFMVTGLLMLCRVSKDRLMQRLMLPPYVSLCEELVELFLTEWYDSPITPTKSQLQRLRGQTETFDDTYASRFGRRIKRNFPDRVKRGALLDKVRVPDLESGLAVRKVMLRVMRLPFRVSDDFTSFVLSPKLLTNSPSELLHAFKVPDQELNAPHLFQLARSIDKLLDDEDDKPVRHLESIMTLEQIALRLRTYYISFLRKVNGLPTNDANEEWDHSARVSAFKAYTAAVEEQGHFIDLASDFLCDRAYVHDYVQLTQYVQHSVKMFDNSEKSEKTFIRSRLSVHIISASGLMNLDKWNGSYSDPYCTVEVAGKPETMVETHYAEDSLSPCWDYHCEINGYTFGDTLRFKVFDKDVGIKQDDLLGEVELSSFEFETAPFEGDLMLLLPKSKKEGNVCGSIHVAVGVIRGGEDDSLQTSISALMRSPTSSGTLENSLRQVLLRNRLAYKKMLKIVQHIIKHANRTAADKRWNCLAEIDHSRRTEFWRLIEHSLLLTVSEKLKSAMPEHMDPKQRREQDGKVDAVLKQLAEEPEYDSSNILEGTNLIMAKVAVKCDSFVIMKAVLQSIVEMDQLLIHSVESTWKVQRQLPLISVKVSLAEEGRFPTRFMKITLAHTRILAIVCASTAGNYEQLLHQVPNMCKTLRIEDPDVHPSMWCISLAQLRQLASFAKDKLGDKEYAEAHMYDIVKKVVIDATAGAKMSYARMLNWQELRHVDVFVSHAWKENFQCFVESVESALAQRLRSDEVSLWICSFALFQSRDRSAVAGQIGDELLDAPFDKALRRCKEVLVVRNAEVDNFERAWCVYEIFRARQLNLKITIAGPNCFGSGTVDILTCNASNAKDEKSIKSTIEDANLVQELNSVVTEIKQKGSKQITDTTATASTASTSPVLKPYSRIRRSLPV